MQDQQQLTRPSRSSYLKEELNLINLFPDVSREIRLKYLKAQSRVPKACKFTDISQETRSKARKRYRYTEQLTNRNKNSFYSAEDTDDHYAMRLKKMIIILISIAMLTVVFFNYFEITI